MFFFVLFLLLFFSIVLNLKHFLVVLISLEMLSLWVFFVFFLYNTIYMDLSLLLTLLVATVSESVLGLVLLVSFMRFSSKDYLLGVNMLKF